MLPRFFRTYKNRQFTFIPRFYDKQKEELQERIKRIEKEVQGGQNNTEYTTSIIRGSFRQARGYRARANRNSSLRIIAIIIILLLLVYFLFAL